jgi:septal ring factor EnvC (AmiA/AmiB activator)
MPIPATRSIMAPLSNLFRKKRSLDDLRSTRDERVAALELARDRLEKASEAVTSAAIENSDMLDAAEAEMRASEDRVESLTVAVEAITAQIAAIEQDQAQKRDRAVRESTARDLNARADKFEKLIPLWVDVLRDSAAVGELARPIVGEIGLYEFFKQRETQIPVAIALSLRNFVSMPTRCLPDARLPCCQRPK